MPKHQSVDRTNSEHYVWGDVSDGWRLLQHPDLSITEERVPPGAGEVHHFHSNARQFFYILSEPPRWESPTRLLKLGVGRDCMFLHLLNIVSQISQKKMSFFW